MSIAKEVAEAVAANLADWYSEDAETLLTTDYSGRGMYDRNCVGFYAEPAMVIAAFAKALGEDRNLDWDMELMELAEMVRTDSMGRGTITYFPSLQIINED